MYQIAIYIPSGEIKTALSPHYCFLTAFPLFLHPLNSLISNCLNMHFVAQGRSRKACRDLLSFFFFFFNLFIYFSCVGSSFLCEGFLQLRQAGATLHRGARAPHHRGLSCCGARAPDAQAQQPWVTGPAAPRHVGSSQTRARTRVPCIGRQTPNHCATREAPLLSFNPPFSLILLNLFFFFFLLLYFYFLLFLTFLLAYNCFTMFC